VVSAANLITLGRLVTDLVHGTRALAALGIDPRELLLGAVAIWLTNVLAFASWYWELDRGGLGARCAPHHREPDFLFTQMSTPGAAGGHWTPGFMDYLYLSFCICRSPMPRPSAPPTCSH